MSHLGSMYVDEKCEHLHIIGIVPILTLGYDHIISVRTSEQHSGMQP